MELNTNLNIVDAHNKARYILSSLRFNQPLASVILDITLTRPSLIEQELNSPFELSFLLIYVEFIIVIHDTTPILAKNGGLV